MKESYLHFIWKTKSFRNLPLRCVNGEVVEVRSTGVHNFHAGPDFSFALIEIDGVIRSGPVELHVRASDWLAHKHQFDPRYNDVILHVVYEADQHVPEGVPILQLKNHIWQEQLQHMISLGLGQQAIPCGDRFSEVKGIVRSHWLERMVIERMQNKAHEWDQRLKELQGDLVQLVHEKVARNFGFGLNGEAFEELARRLPYHIIMRYREDDEVFYQLPALLAGVPKNDEMTYSKRTLLVQYKHGLKAMEVHQFNSGRVHPSRKHAKRIALWVSVLPQLTVFWKLLLEETNVGNWIDWMKEFQRQSVHSSVLHSLVVNFFVPMQFLLARHDENENRMELGLQLLHYFSAEDNGVMRKWKKLGEEPKNSSESQAFLHLFNVYCSRKQCLNCAVGAQLLKQHESSKVFF